MTALNIKNHEVVKLARELAEIEGESMTTVVGEALRDRLDRKRKPKIDDTVVQYWLQRGREIRAEIEKHDPDSLNRDPFDDLYDDDLGLPV